MAVNTKQKLAIAGVLAVGVALGSAILTSGPNREPDAGHDHAAEQTGLPTDAKSGHAAGEHDHAEDKAKPAAAAGGAGHADEKSHRHADEKAHRHDEPTTQKAAGAGGRTDGATASSAPAQPGAAGKSGATATKLALTDEQIRASGIQLHQAAAGELVTEVMLPGEIRFNEDRTAHVVPRVAGVVEEVRATLGQQVRRGQVLAVIASAAVSDQRSELAAASRRLELARVTFEREKKLWEAKITAQQDFQQAQAAVQEAEIAVTNARQKLAAVGVSANAALGNRFELRAPFDGTVLEKHVVLGEAVTDSTNLFTISDLGTVWATFNVPAGNLQAVRVGERAIVRAPAMNAQVAGTVSYVGSLIGEQTRTAPARVVIANPQGAWRPGLFVNVAVAAGERRAALTVPSDAVQSIDGKPHVFVRVAEGFVARPVQTGATSGKRVEITTGLEPGATVASAGSFVLKSELEKGSSDGHAH